MADETYSAHPAMFRSNPLGFILALALIPAFGVGLVILLVWYLMSISHHIEVASDRVRYSHGLLSKDRVEIAVSSIRSVRVRQSLFQRIMSTGDLSIFTAGDQPEIVIKGIPHPYDAKRLLDPGQA
jgi:uncharacterized membrane protein YdbT with pleckstrin-like domain